MYGYVYKIIFPEGSFGVSGCSFYIGQKKGKSIDEFYWGSGTKVIDWFKKRGKQSWHSDKSFGAIRKILCECESQDELNEKECFYVNCHLGESLCLNLVAGGSHPFATDELKQKISINTKIAMQRPEVKEKYRKSLKTRFTEDTLKKMSKAAKKNKNYLKMNKSNIEKHKEITASPVKREKRRQKKAEKTGIKIICVETGEIFDSISNAQKILKCYHISDVINGKRSHSNGLHFLKFTNS